MTKLVEIKGLVKEYGFKKALDDLNLEMESGKIVGLLGPNESGKSTLLKILAGHAKKNSGMVKIDGNDIGGKTKSITAYLPDGEYLDKNWSVKQAVIYFHDIYDDFNMVRMKEIMEFLKIEDNSRIRELSKGMREKLYLALTLSRDAKLYLLDEPLGGIDIVSREKILKSIMRFFNEDSTIIISTHLLWDVEKIFDDVIFMNNGKVDLIDNAEDLRFREKKSVSEKFTELYGDN